jgi:hypothetical protein
MGVAIVATTLTYGLSTVAQVLVFLRIAKALGANLRVSDVLPAQLAGQAVNLCLPLNNVGEAHRASMPAHRAPLPLLLGAVAAYNLLFWAASAGLVLVGAALAPSAPTLPVAPSVILAAVGTAMALPAACLLWMLFRGAIGGAVAGLGRAVGSTRVPERFRVAAGVLDSSFRHAGASRRGLLGVAVLWMVVARGLQALEPWVACFVLGEPIPLGLGITTDAVNQVVYWVAGVLPGQVGVMEAASAEWFEAVGRGEGLGLSMELARRGRKVV